MTNIDQVNPVFQAALRKAAKDLSREGGLPSAQGLKAAEATSKRVKLSTLVDPQTHTIREARHTGASSEAERTVLDALCGILPGLTVQEAADHSVLRLMDRLRDRTQPVPVKGILLPKNADPLFDLPLQLVRGLRSGYVQATGSVSTENFYEIPPSPRWVALSQDEKLAAVQKAIAAFAQAQNLGANDLVLVDLEPDLLKHDVRVVMTFSDTIPPERKPPLMRLLERALKDGVETRLQLYMQELKDKNVIRRL